MIYPQKKKRMVPIITSCWLYSKFDDCALNFHEMINYFLKVVDFSKENGKKGEEGNLLFFEN